MHQHLRTCNTPHRLALLCTNSSLQDFTNYNSKLLNCSATWFEDDKNSNCDVIATPSKYNDVVFLFSETRVSASNSLKSPPGNGGSFTREPLSHNNINNNNTNIIAVNFSSTMMMMMVVVVMMIMMMKMTKTTTTAMMMMMVMTTVMKMI